MLQVRCIRIGRFLSIGIYYAIFLKGIVCVVDIQRSLIFLTHAHMTKKQIIFA